MNPDDICALFNLISHAIKHWLGNGVHVVAFYFDVN